MSNSGKKNDHKEKKVTAKTARVEEEMPTEELRPPGAVVQARGSDRSPGRGEALPAELMGDMQEYAGAGTSDKREDSVTPFLYIVQKNSPQVNKRDPDYIDGIEAGDLLNTATKRFWKGDGPDSGLECVPALFLKKEVEWVPRTAGGGYVATHAEDTPLLRQVREVEKPGGKGVIRMLPNGTQLVTTKYQFVVLAETLDLVCVPFTSTGLQTHRQWNQAMRNHRVRGPAGLLVAPAFSRSYILRTVYRTNEAGDWFGLGFEDGGWVRDATRDAYVVAKEFFVLSQTHEVVIGRPPSAVVSEEAPIDESKIPI